MKAITLFLLLFVTLALNAQVTRTFYVDFVGGNDANAGTSTSSAWKHAPGDPAAVSVPGSATLRAGDKVLFKGGVRYRGRIDISASGASGNPIVFKGDDNTWGTGKAIIDGSIPLAGTWTRCASPADCGGNPNWNKIWYITNTPANTDALEANLHQANNMLKSAQFPNPADPFFMDERSSFSRAGSFSKTELTADTVGLIGPGITMGYVYLNKSGNRVEARKIRTFTAATRKITYDAASGDLENNQYSITNCLSPFVFDQPGEYVFDEANRKIYLWPLNDVDPNTVEISISVLGDLVTLDNSNNHVTVEGISFQKAISRFIYAYNNTYITIRNNEFIKGRAPSYTTDGLSIAAGRNILVEGNYLTQNAFMRGIGVGEGSAQTAANNVIRNNRVIKVGGTGIFLDGVATGEISGNVVLDCRGTHANGITSYCEGSLGVSTNLVVKNNIVLGGFNAFTCYRINGLKLFNNIFDGNNESAPIGCWIPSTLSNVEIYHNVLIRSGVSGSVFLNEGENINNLTLKNNILDALPSNITGTITHNLYTSAGGRVPDASKHEYLETDLTKIFANAAAHDYHLRMGSPAVDSGTDVGVSRDIENIERLPATGIDLGAHVYFRTDFEAPSVPEDLDSSNVKLSGFTLSWSASTDNIVVAKYEVFKDGTFYTSVTGTTAAITGLIANTTYTMRVRARDLEGNYSALSEPLNVTTSYSSDVLPPSVPRDLVANNISIAGFNLSWTASTDDVGVVAYDVYKNGAFHTSVPGTTVSITGLTPKTAYTMTVKARDEAGRTSDASTPLVVTTIGETSTQTWQYFPVSTQTGQFTATFDVRPNTNQMDGVIGIQDGPALGYGRTACAVRFFTNGRIDAVSGEDYTAGTPIPYTAGTNYHFRLVINRPAHTYSIYVTPEGQSEMTLGTNYAFRTSQASVPQLTGWSLISYIPSFTVSNMRFTPAGGGDTQPPTKPNGLAVSNKTSTGFTLSWNGSTDNVGVTGYNVYKNGAFEKSVTSTTAAITNLTPNTAYSMTVKAKDAAENLSDASDPLNVTTNPSPGGITMGETALLGTPDSGNGNLLLAQQAVLSEPGTLLSLSFYVTEAAGQLRLGVYRDNNGKPGTLAAQTASFVPVVGWNTHPVATQVQLVAGTYWLAYLPSSNNLSFLVANPSGTTKYYPFTFGSLPASFSTSTSDCPCHWSFYATLSSGTLSLPGSNATGDGSVKRGAPAGSVSVYPVPASGGQFYIDFGKNIAGAVTVEIFDTNGRLVFTRNYTNKRGRVWSIDHTLKTGTYFIKIKEAQKVETRKLIVVQ